MRFIGALRLLTILAIWCSGVVVCGRAAGELEKSGTETPPNSAGFLAKLSAEESAGIGVAKLSAEQRAALDALIARELRLARQGGARAFARTFLDRRSDEERTKAGVNLMTESERGALNGAVAHALATQPFAREMAFAPKRNRAGDVVTVTWPKPEIHGEMTLVYGWDNHGGDYRGASLHLTRFDPKYNLTTSFTYSVVEGDGLFGRRGYDGRGGWYDGYGCR
jgi:hypothetical protein